MEQRPKSRRIAVQFEHVTKCYKLYKSDRARIKGLINKKIPYKKVYANNDLSFTIYRGESVALIGPNGAGKSTALKLVTGVAYPTSGTITVNGHVNALLQLKAGFDPTLTGRENIYLRCQIDGIPNEKIAKLEPRIVEFAELGAYIDQPLRTYSSGMKARLGFAIAAFSKPKILIVDEALSVGDKRFNKKCRRRINKIVAKDKTTLLFVTHNAKSAEQFCERGIVLIDGKLHFDGPIRDALAYYDRYLDSIALPDDPDEGDE